MKKLLIVIAIITLVASCNSPYVTIMDERGKIITLREPQYSKYTEKGDTVVFVETMYEGQIYNSIWSTYNGIIPADEFVDNNISYYFKAVVID